MILTPNFREALPVETVAWISVRAAVSPFLTANEIALFLSALHGRQCSPNSPREAALENFPGEQAELGVDSAVARLLACNFDEDECLALVAFAGMVRRYPDVCRLTTAK